MADQTNTAENQDRDEVPEAQNQIEPEAAVMSGFGAHEIGLNAKTPEKQAEMEPPLPSAPDPQDLRNEISAQEDNFAGNSKKADTFAYNIAMQQENGNGPVEGPIAGKSFGSGSNDAETKREKDERLLHMLEEIKTLQQLWKDFDELSQKVDETIVVYEGLSQELNDSFLKIQNASHEAGRKFVEETQKLQSLKDQLKQAQEQNDTTRIEALRKDVERQQILVDSKRAIYETQANVLMGLDSDQKQANLDIKNLKRDRDTLKTKLESATTEEDRAAIQTDIAKLEQEIEQKNIEFQQKLEQAQKAEELSAKMNDFAKDNTLSREEISALKTIVGNDPELKPIVVSAIAATVAAGLSVTHLDGTLISGQSAASYLNAEMEVNSIDSRRYEIEKQLQESPDDLVLKNELANLATQRLEMESKAGMCFMDLAQDQRTADLKALPEYDTLHNATVELKDSTIDAIKIEGHLVFEEGGQYVLKNATQNYNVAEMLPEEQAMVLSQIQTQLDQGKQIAPPEAADKLAAVQTASADFIKAAKEIADSNGETASSIASDETEKAIGTQSDQTEAHNLNVPEHHLDEYDAAQDEVLAAAAAAVSSGQAVTQEQVEKLSKLAGMSEDKVKDLLREKNAEVEEPSLVAGTVPQVFGGAGTYQLVKAATLATIAPALLLGAGTQMEYPSFAESKQFEETNQKDPKAAAIASYNLGLKSDIDVSGIYASKMAPTAPQQTTTLDQQQRDLEQRLALEERLRQQQQAQALMAAQLGGPTPPTSSSGQVT